MSSNVLSFAEESCWDGEIFRSVRREVVFVVAGHAIQRGKAIRHEFRADYGLFYDYEDTLLLQILSSELPNVDWGRMVYWKRQDIWSIHIIDPEDDSVVGSIFVRGQSKQKLSSEIMGGNIVPITKAGEFRARRLARDQERAEKRRRQRRPEDEGPDGTSS